MLGVMLFIDKRRFLIIHLMLDMIYISEDNFIHGEWQGLYSCPNDNQNVSFVLNTTQLASSIGLSANFVVQIHNIPMSGTYASFLKIIQLHSDYFDAKEMISPIQNWGFVHVNMEGQLINNRRIVGEIIFESVTCVDIVCPMEMTRVQGKKFSFLHACTI